MANHPKHPKCPKCGRSMYKTMVKGKPVSKSDPWAYCRNPKCELYEINQSGELTVDERAEGKTEPEPVPEEFVDAIEAKGSNEAVADGTVGEGDDGGNDPSSRPKTEPKDEKPDGNAVKDGKGKKTAKKAAKKTTKKGGKKKAPTNKADPPKKAKKTEKKAGKKVAKKDSKKATNAELGNEPPTGSEPSDNSAGEPEHAAAPADAPDGELPEELVNGRSDDFRKAAARIQGAVNDNGPFSKNICDLALSMITKAEGAEAAAKLVEHFDLTTWFGITAPVA